MGRFEWRLVFVGILVCAGIAWACGQPAVTYVEPAPVIAVPAAGTAVIAQPAPVIVQQPHHDGFWQGLWLGHALSGSSNTHTREVHHHTVTPVPVSTPAYRAPSVTTWHAPAAPIAPTRTVVAPSRVTKVYSAPPRSSSSFSRPSTRVTVRSR